jgi:hypothetical protein
LQLRKAEYQEEETCMSYEEEASAYRLLYMLMPLVVASSDTLEAKGVTGE